MSLNKAEQQTTADESSPIWNPTAKYYSFMHEDIKDSVYEQAEGEFINRIFHVASA